MLGKMQLSPRECAIRQVWRESWRQARIVKRAEQVPDFIRNKIARGEAARAARSLDRLSRHHYQFYQQAFVCLFERDSPDSTIGDKYILTYKGVLAALAIEPTQSH